MLRRFFEFTVAASLLGAAIYFLDQYNEADRKNKDTLAGREVGCFVHYYCAPAVNKDSLAKFQKYLAEKEAKRLGSIK